MVSIASNRTSNVGGSRSVSGQSASTRSLRYGSRGQDVRSMQDNLRAAGFNIKADGIFGPKTASAVRAFQNAKGLKVDGVVGPQTRGAFAAAGNRATGGGASGATAARDTGGAQGVQNNSTTGSGTAGQIDRALGGVLRGKGQAFVDAGQKYGVDPKLLAAISMHETGNGTSRFARELNNVGGIMDPKHNWQRGKQFSSMNEGIDYMARNLKRGYIDKGLRTLEQIQRKYAPVGARNDSRGLNRHWVGGVRSNLRRMGGG